VKAAGEQYLPRPAGMQVVGGVDQYAAYRDRAVWLGATERAVHGLTGTIFRRDLQQTVPRVLERQLADITQTGVPLRSFAEQVVRETLLIGRYGILVDFPAGIATPAGLLPPSVDARPYWIGYKANEMVNWRTEQRQGDTILTLVVLKEHVSLPQGPWPTDDFFVLKDQVQYRVLRLDEAGRYEVTLWIEQPDAARHGQVSLVPTAPRIPLRQNEPLDFIPFVFVSPFSLEPAVEKSLLEALVEINYQHYRHSADYEHGLHLTALPTPYVCASMLERETQLLIGSATAWVIQDSTAKVGMLEFHGQGLQSHERAMETDLTTMAMLGARLLEGAPLVPETATAVLQRLQGGESPLQSLVRTVSEGLTQTLRTHAWWAGVTEDPADPALAIRLNSDLVSAKMEPPMLKTLIEALLNNVISYETFYYQLQQGEIARPLVTVEDEQALLAQREAATPAPAAPPPQVTSNGTAAAV
jgi:hypothetical protein